MNAKNLAKVSLLIFIGLLIVSVSCSLSSSGTPSTRNPGVPTAILPKPTVIPPTPDFSAPAGQNWEIEPFKVGEPKVDNPEPGWNYIVIYYGVKNLGNQIDYYTFYSNGPTWLNADDIPLSYPSVEASYISTDQGYDYYIDKSYWYSMPMIFGDEEYFYYNAYNDETGYVVEGQYSPQYDLMPAIPPDFRLFGSISFKIAGNTTGWKWIVPGAGEFEVSKINRELNFPLDQRPSYLKKIGESLILENKIKATPLIFIRNDDGTASIDLLFENPTGYDFHTNGFQVHLINSRGWLVGQKNYFVCGMFNCPDVPVVGPGLSATLGGKGFLELKTGQIKVY